MRKYIKLEESGRVVRCPTNDFQGLHTGKCVMNLPAYFDDHPDERRALGWVLQVFDEPPEYNGQTEYLQKSVTSEDAYTQRVSWHVMQKTEEMLLLEEMNATLMSGDYHFDLNDAYWMEGN